MLLARLTARPRPVGRRSLLTRIRQAGNVPGVLYGHGEPLPIQLPRRAVEQLLARQGSGGLVELDLNGSIETALVKEVDHHPATGELVNLGLQRVVLTEEVTARVPIAITGTERLTREHGVVETALTELEIQCRAADLPAAIAINLSEAKVGDSLRVADLRLPPGVRPAPSVDPEQIVVSITSPAVPAEVEEELEAAAAAGEAAAGR